VVFVNVVKPPSSEKYCCPCCGYRTLTERGGYDICRVCFWEDDGQDDHDDDLIRGGPNYGLSLTQARLNFSSIGACEERFPKNVRKPNESEIEPKTNL
jgi:hypothetical protein